ncbi:MAG: YggS family pyridoxal phosphate-dependent enzyme [Gammaproteobacteria bacterium]|nr:YggS family pyridoxal phosphate-dependent enzyme [Gammaproteobacteria bacterium]
MQTGESSDVETPTAGGYQALSEMRTRIAEAAQRAGRLPNSIALLAVSKGQTLGSIRRIVAHGQLAFGENYVQEALPKIAALPNLRLEWHFIGRLQANKTRDIAEQFSWVHSVDRLKLAERLSAQRPSELPALNCCIEINLNAEATKGGIEPGALSELVSGVRALPRLRLRGFMALPTPSSDPTVQRASFRIFREMVTPYVSTFDTLSMGTSTDFEAAIAEGATIVRIGTALFGARAE